MIKVNYDADTGRVIGFNLDTEPHITITEEERRQPLPDKYSYYVVENGRFTIARRTPTAAEEKADAIALIRAEMAAIKKWRSESTEYVIKMLLGEIKKTDKGWLTYIAQRAQARDRLAELEEALNVLNKP